MLGLLQIMLQMDYIWMKSKRVHMHSFPHQLIHFKHWASVDNHQWSTLQTIDSPTQRGCNGSSSDRANTNPSSSQILLLLASPWASQTKKHNNYVTTINKKPSSKWFKYVCVWNLEIGIVERFSKPCAPRHPKLRLVMPIYECMRSKRAWQNGRYINKLWMNERKLIQ